MTWERTVVIRSPVAAEAALPPFLNAEAPLAPGLSEIGFRVGLYVEHLEEAGFLYEQRRALLDDREVAWSDLDAFEDRREAHLDALLLGGAVASTVCRQRAPEGEPGEFYAALCIACRHRSAALLSALLDTLDPADDDRVRAAADALCDELPREWRPMLLGMITGQHAGLQRVAARVIGYRRIPLGAELSAGLPACDPAARADAAWALGRVRPPAAVAPLRALFDGAAGPARDAAGLALLRLGEWRVVSATLERADAAAPLALVGLGGGWTEFKEVLQRVAQRRVGEEGVLALGLFGCPLAIDTLLEALGEDALARASADALQLITGAGLYGDVFVPEHIEEDERFDDEHAVGTTEVGALPGEAATQSGTMVTQLSRDPALWRAWWSENAARFQPTLRYREGRPHAPEALLATLVDGRSSRRLRALTAEEMLVRYGLDVPFETDLPVRYQRRALQEYANRGAAVVDRGEPGAWNLGGQRLTD